MIAPTITPEQQHAEDLRDGIPHADADRLLVAAWQREYARRPSRHNCEANVVKLTTVCACGVCGTEVSV